MAEIHESSKQRSKWENRSFNTVKGPKLTSPCSDGHLEVTSGQILAATRGIACWHEAKGDKSVSCFFRLGLFDEWTLIGLLKQGKIETIVPGS